MIRFILLVLLFCSCTMVKSKSTKQGQQVDLFKLIYRDQLEGDSIFFEGYQIRAKKTIKDKQVNDFFAALKDSSNYLNDNARNCVSIATYGFRIHGESSDQIVFVGNEPCLKIIILDEKTKIEIIKDLIATNTISAFLENVFP